MMLKNCQMLLKLFRLNVAPKSYLCESFLHSFREAVPKSGGCYSTSCVNLHTEGKSWRAAVVTGAAAQVHKGNDSPSGTWVPGHEVY